MPVFSRDSKSCRSLSTQEPQTIRKTKPPVPEQWLCLIRTVAEVDAIAPIYNSHSRCKAFLKNAFAPILRRFGIVNTLLSVAKIRISEQIAKIIMDFFVWGASNEHKFGRLYSRFGKFSIKSSLFWIKILSLLYLSTDLWKKCPIEPRSRYGFSKCDCVPFL